MTTDVDNFLAHYGVKGMQWGKVKQAKPVSAEKQAKREGRAQKFDKKAADIQMSLDKLNAIKPKNTYHQMSLAEQRNDLKRLKDTAVKDAEAKRQGKLSSNEKKVIIGASVVAALVAVKLTKDGLESGVIRQSIEKGKEFVTGQKFEFKKNPNLLHYRDSDDIHAGIVQKINPGYGGIGTKMNCRRCTFAYELRRRGYDVQATKTTNAYGQHGAGLFNALNPDQKGMGTSKGSVIFRAVKEAATKDKGGATPLTDMTKNFSAGGKNKIGGTATEIFQTLSKQPNGSRGELGVQWAPGGGHSMIYEIFNGKAVIFDGQTGKRYDDAEAFISGLPSVSAAGFTRLDNVPLNTEYLTRWLKNA